MPLNPQQLEIRVIRSPSHRGGNRPSQVRHSVRVTQPEDRGWAQAAEPRLREASPIEGLPQSTTATLRSGEVPAHAGEQQQGPSVGPGPRTAGKRSPCGRSPEETAAQIPPPSPIGWADGCRGHWGSQTCQPSPPPRHLEGTHVIRLVWASNV